MRHVETVITTSDSCGNIGTSQPRCAGMDRERPRSMEDGGCDGRVLEVTREEQDSLPTLPLTGRRVKAESTTTLPVY